MLKKQIQMEKILERPIKGQPAIIMVNGYKLKTSPVVNIQEGLFRTRLETKNTIYYM